jgi:hypothetical protein
MAQVNPQFPQQSFSVSASRVTQKAIPRWHFRPEISWRSVGLLVSQGSQHSLSRSHLIRPINNQQIQTTIFKQAAKSLAALNLPSPVRRLKLRLDNLVSQPLVRAFPMEMGNVFSNHLSQGGFAKQDEMVQAFLTNSSDPALQMRI